MRIVQTKQLLDLFELGRSDFYVCFVWLAADDSHFHYILCLIKQWLSIAKGHFIDINQFIEMKNHKGHMNSRKEVNDDSADSSEEE